MFDADFYCSAGSGGQSWQDFNFGDVRLLAVVLMTLNKIQLETTNTEFEVVKTILRQVRM